MPEHLSDLAALAKQQFINASLRGTAVPLGIAVVMADGHVLSWNNTPSDLGEGDEAIAVPLHTLTEGSGVAVAEDLGPHQEVGTIVICAAFNMASPETALNDAAKNALAAYIGTRDGHVIHLIHPENSGYASLKL